MDDGTTGRIRHRRVAIVGNHLPRHCGIATFTTDLVDALSREVPTLECLVVAMNAGGERPDYPARVRLEIDQDDLGAYRRAARALNDAGVDAVSLQHEFGIYGGPAGSYVLELLRGLEVPVVTTFHTVLPMPDEGQRAVLEGIARLSDRVVVMSQGSASLLQDVYGIARHKIDVIPHGSPTLPERASAERLGLQGRSVLLTFGLLSPDKGIEYAIDAMPAIVARQPQAIYVVLGVTHPQVRAEHGETYRRMLESRAEGLEMSGHVRFVDRFVSQSELVEYIAVADIYTTPYLNAQQSTSGTLAYAVGCGKAVVSTPYQYAQELLSDGRGLLVSARDGAAIATAVVGLFDAPEECSAMKARAAAYGARMGWPAVARRYLETLNSASRTAELRPAGPSIRVGRLSDTSLPRLDLTHLRAMTDDTGLLQHATFNIPCYSEGYCLDDNARALLLMVQLEADERLFPQLTRTLAARYLAFVQHAFDAQTGHFRNFLSYSRTWAAGPGSDDSHGRALWALGAVVGRSVDPGHVGLAQRLFHAALPAASKATSPRAWAYTLLGLDELSRRLPRDARVEAVRSDLAGRLVARFSETATDAWPWFEDRLTYCNARLAQALLVSASHLQDDHMRGIGLRALEWLVAQHVGPAGEFAPVGTNGFFVRAEVRAQYDQQPVEASCMVSACLSAAAAVERAPKSGGRDVFLAAPGPVGASLGHSRPEHWREIAVRAFEWFLGGNSRRQGLYDRTTGGCRDGIHIDRLNENQGAESTLAFLMALTEMQGVVSARAGVSPSSARPQTPTRQLANVALHA